MTDQPTISDGEAQLDVLLAVRVLVQARLSPSDEGATAIFHELEDADLWTKATQGFVLLAGKLLEAAAHAGGQSEADTLARIAGRMVGEEGRQAVPGADTD